MKYIKEPTNTITHFIGFCLGIIGLIVLLIKSVNPINPVNIAASLIYGISLISLYFSSTIYHAIKGNERVTYHLKKLDHSMIYVLIAGTYTPVCLITLKGVLGYSLMAVIWGLAIVGIIVKLAWKTAPRVLYTSFYLIMGWVAVFFIYPIYKSIAFEGFMYLIAGGLMYSIGSVIYAFKFKKLKFSIFGFHEIFHLFVLAGSGFHYLMITKYIIQ